MKNPKNKKKKGFTLVELVITIAIIVVLSTISIPIYKDYIHDSKLSEAYLLLANIRDAQCQYYNNYGCFFKSTATTSKDEVLDVNAGRNKYYKSFIPGLWATNEYFSACVPVPEYGHAQQLKIWYNLTTGSTFYITGLWN